MTLIAMQARCVHCLREQYALNVLAVSYGDAGCAFCGGRSAPMTREQWHHILTDRQEPPIDDEPRFSCLTCRARFATLEELLAHLRDEHPPPPTTVEGLVAHPDDD